MPEANIHEVGGFDVLVVGILVWLPGNYITGRSHFLPVNIMKYSALLFMLLCLPAISQAEKGQSIM